MRGREEMSVLEIRRRGWCFYFPICGETVELLFDFRRRGVGDLVSGWGGAKAEQGGKDSGRRPGKC
jgi:hypothetical protein